MVMSIKARTTALIRRLTPLVDKDDPKHQEILQRLANQLAIAEEAQQLIEKEGLTVETASTTKAHPAINILHNATLCAIRLFGKLDVKPEVQEDFLDLD